MFLRGVDFGCVWDASGSRGFFNEGYWYQRLQSFFGLDPCEGTFISKTITLERMSGNMPLNDEDGITPVHFKPDCIRVFPRSGATINAVGLSNPGAVHVLTKGLLQLRREPFLISFMPTGENVNDRLWRMIEFEQFCRPFITHDEWGAPFGLQLNLQCPNKQIGMETGSDLVDEALEMLSIAGKIGVPLVLKFDSTLDVVAALQLSRHEHCDALSISNAVKWDDVPVEIRQQYFGTHVSPLTKYGGGAVSGPPILPLTKSWLRRATRVEFGCPIGIGGGIVSPSDAEEVIRMHEQIQCIELGTIRLHRPWRYNRTARHIRTLMHELGRDVEIEPPTLRTGHTAPLA